MTRKQYLIWAMLVLLILPAGVRARAATAQIVHDPQATWIERLARKKSAAMSTSAQVPC